MSDPEAILTSPVIGNRRQEEEVTMVRVGAEELDETTPRISADTRLDELSVCTRSIFRSKAGAVREGVILKSSDPRVVLLPDCFQPLLERVVALWTPIDDPFDDR